MFWPKIIEWVIILFVNNFTHEMEIKYTLGAGDMSSFLYRLVASLPHVYVVIYL